MDFNPALKITLDTGKVHEVTRANCVLYTYAGELSSRDHVYLDGTDPEGVGGAYLFKLCHDFESISRFIIDNGFECHLNQRTISECDESAFQTFLDRSATESQVPDTLPADFA